MKKRFRLPPIIPIIIYHGLTPFSGPRDLRELREKIVEYEKQSLSLEAIVIDLSVIPDDELPHDPNVPELHATLKLMKYIFHKDFAAKFQEVLESLVPYTGPKYRHINRLMWFYACGRARHFTLADAQRIAKKVTNKHIKENEMPSLLKRITKHVRRQVKTEERKEGKINMILFLLSSRIGHVPQSLEKQLHAIAPTDSDRLNELALLASRCESLEEFEKAL